MPGRSGPSAVLAGFLAVLCCGLPILILFLASAGSSLASFLFPDAKTVISYVFVVAFAIGLTLFLVNRWGRSLSPEQQGDSCDNCSGEPKES